MDSEKKDYYAALGVSRTESLQGIHQAYRKLAKQCHPDHAGDQGRQRFQEIQEAYEVLSDPEQRKQYDVRAARQRRARSVAPEPPVRSHPYRRDGRPEPLVSPSFQAEELFEPTASGCLLCGGLSRHLGFGCLFCGRENELERLLVRYLNAFRRPPF